MNNAKLAALVLGAGLLSACASQPGSVRSYGDQWIDHDRVSAVEREAKRAGVEVRWVNPPTNRDGQG